MLKAIIALSILICLLLLTSIINLAHADTLSLIKQRGVITIGVKVDYPPWGMLSSAGDIVGFEPDLANLIAQDLGVTLKLKAVTSGNRFQQLEEGQVDLLIATVGDTQQRRKRVTMIEPHYYRSGVTALSHKKAKIQDWSDLKGQKVCLYGGAYFNKKLIQDYQIEPLILFNTRDAQLALLTNKCVAWAYDNAAIYHLLESDSWTDFQAQAPIIYPILWSIVTNKGSKAQSLTSTLENIAIDWQRNTTLSQYAAKWLLPDQAYLANRALLWNQRDADGNFICRFDQARHLPSQCDQSPIDTPKVQDSLWPFDKHDSLWLLTAFYQTLLFTLAVVLLTLIFAYLFTLFSLLSNPYLRKLINGVINIQRSIPPIVLLYLLYFGLFSSPFSQTGILSVIAGGAITTALLVLSLYTGAGISSLLEDYIESQQLTRQYPHLHYAFNACQHGIIANLINLVKASAMASALSVPNAILVTTSLVASQGHTAFLMTLLMFFYFFEVMLFSKALGYFFRLFVNPKQKKVPIT